MSKWFVCVLYTMWTLYLIYIFNYCLIGTSWGLILLVNCFLITWNSFISSHFNFCGYVSFTLSHMYASYKKLGFFQNLRGSHYKLKLPLGDQTMSFKMVSKISRNLVALQGLKEALFLPSSLKSREGAINCVLLSIARGHGTSHNKLRKAGQVKLKMMHYNST